MAGIKCATCPHLIHEKPLYWCGLERTENSDVDVTEEWDGDAQEWKPFMHQPKWCKLSERSEQNGKVHNRCERRGDTL